MKHFIIIIAVSFLSGVSGICPESPAYADGDTYEKVWDSGNILPDPVYTAAVCDLDLDGKTEIIVSDNSKTYDGKIFIFENSGDDSYQLVWNSGGIIAGNDCYIGIAVGDLDKDGKREIITLDHQPMSGNMKVYVLENTGDNTYQLAWDSGDTLFGEDGASVFTGDADSDGKSEIIVGTGWGHANKGKIYVFENTGNDSYEEVWNSGGALIDSVLPGAVGDLDKDGKKEIIVGSGDIDPQIHVFENTGDNSYALVWDSGSFFNRQMRVTIGDADNDGKEEIIAGSVDKLVCVFENAGDNSYQLAWTSPVMPHYMHFVSVGDQDYDGKKEIIAPCQDNVVYLFENTSDDTYEMVWNSGNLLGGIACQTVPGDTDGDGKGEIIVPCYDKKVYVFEAQQTPANTGEIFEDFSVCNSEWLEYDPENKIVIDCTNDHRLEFNYWRRYQPAYVYRPFSTTDFVLEYDINISNHGGNGNVVGPGFSDTCGTTNTIQNGIFSVFYAGWPGSGGVPHLDLHIYENGTQILDWTEFLDLLISTGTTYYLRVEKSGGKVTFSIFSDASRTNHISGSPKTFTTNLINTTFNYFYAVNGPHTSPQDNWEWTTGWIDNIHAFGIWANQPPVVDAGLDQTVEQETYEGTEVTQIGHVSDTDGDALTYQWTEGDKVLASGTIPAPNEPPTDADVILTHIFPPGEHTVTLTVNDGEISSSDDVLITVRDTIPPNSSVSFDPVPNSVGWNNTDVKVTITAADSNSGVKEIHYTLSTGSSNVVMGDTAKFTLQEPVEYTIVYYAVDNGDNTEYPPKQAAVKIDKMTPQTGYTIAGTSTANPNEYKDTAEVTLTATDDLSQVKEVKYSINGNWNTVTGNEAKFTLGEPGTYTITYYAVDYADNVESTQQFTVKIVDTILPVSTLTTNPAAPGGFDGWFKSTVRVTITAEDSGSGVKEICYKKDSDTLFTIVQGDQAVFYPGDGTYTIEYHAIDKAGNEESPHKTYNFKVDTAAPGTAAAVHGNGFGNTYINHAALLLKASDVTSGVKEIHYIINGSETVVSNANATINLNQAGTYTIQYWAIDNAGNQETHHSLQLEIISPQAGVVGIKNIIANLPNTAFAKNAQNRKNAFLNKLDQVIAAIDSGQYPNAINKLVNDIGKKTDGCVTSGAADKNDWIVDCQAQAQLNTWINILVAGLAEMMNG
jgi:hypothetical protein